MNIDFEELKEMIKADLDGQVDLSEFEVFWQKFTAQNESMIYGWIGEALLNHYLRYLELKEAITK
jgi:hypothetical protein